VEAEEMDKQFFPIGTVVLLEGGEKRLMIHGILPEDSESGKTYDYIGVLYPEGFIDSENCFLFNGGDIKTVEFVGYINAEQQAFRTKVAELLAEEAN
jgi:hypothetical protein